MWGDAKDRLPAFSYSLFVNGSAIPTSASSKTMSVVNEYKCLKEFIEIYKSEACLWQVNSPSYYDRVTRNAAYSRLVHKWREVEPSATKSTILRKINNLRSCYRKEWKKVQKSKESGATGEDVYEPKLWYYKLFEFVDNQEMSQTSRKDNRSDEDPTERDEEESRSYDDKPSEDIFTCTKEEIQPTPATYEIQRPASQVSAIFLTSEYHQRPPSQVPVTHLSSEAHQRPPSQVSAATHLTSKSRKRKLSSSYQPEGPYQTDSDTKTLKKEVLMTVRDHFRQQHKSEDRWDMFGKVVTMKLRDLDANQRRYAEKYINDVLFEAEGGNLDGTYAFLRQVPSHTQSSSSVPSSSIPSHRMHYNTNINDSNQGSVLSTTTQKHASQNVMQQPPSTPLFKDLP